jgi:hypothetical protein
VRAAALRPTSLRLRVNGADVGLLTVAPGPFAIYETLVPGARWRRELNDVVLESAAAELRVSAVDFAREPRP